MKRFLIILFIFLLSACNDNAAVEELKENYPEIKEVAEQFPESVQEKLAVPTVLPFEPKNVALTYAGDMPGNPKRDILHTEFVYGDGVGVNLHVTTYHNKNTTWASDEETMKTVELKDGTEALIEGDAINVKQIRWKKDGTYYSIMLIKAPKIEKEFTIDDVVKTANSMEY
jgi:hypothetical protein